MIRSLVLLVAALALALPGHASAQSERGPSTPAERRRVVEITRKLEKQPFGKGANTDRVWLMKWIDEVPDVTVRYCPGPLYDLVDGTAQEKALWVQSLFGMASFEIEHPDEAADWVKTQIAGLDSAMAAYQSTVKANPDSKMKVFERLLAAKKAGKLADVVKDQMNTCNPEYQSAPDAI